MGIDVASSGGVSRRGGTLIMGVDDDATNLKLLRSMVGAFGHAFIGAESGLECLSMLYRV